MEKRKFLNFSIYDETQHEAVPVPSPSDENKPLHHLRKVLIVDDNALNIIVLNNQLKILGIEADLCNSGEEALKLAERIPYSLVFMDINMPKMDGWEASARLEIISPKSSIIVVSASINNYDYNARLLKNIVGYLPKPLCAKNLRSVVNKFLKEIAT